MVNLTLAEGQGKDKLDLDFERAYDLPMTQTAKPWTEFDLIAFDTETSGAWPVGCDVVEFGAVKWSEGREVDHLQFLLKPREPMSAFIIGIHGITNEMVAEAPPIADVVHTIHEFFKDSVLMAHHAPFDLGFMALEFEKAKLPFPRGELLCTSLLARKLISGVENHKLQTLAKALKIDGGAVHRALDDARTCMQVGLHCLNLLGPDATLQEAVEVQGKTLRWTDFVIPQTGVMATIAEAIGKKQDVEFIYDRGTAVRQAKPLGVVRNPDGDFMQAICRNDRTSKRFYVAKIRDVGLTPPVNLD